MSLCVEHFVIFWFCKVGAGFALAIEKVHAGPSVRCRWQLPGTGLLGVCCLLFLVLMVLFAVQFCEAHAAASRSAIGSEQRLRMQTAAASGGWILNTIVVANASVDEKTVAIRARAAAV